MRSLIKRGLPVKVDFKFLCGLFAGLNYWAQSIELVAAFLTLLSSVFPKMPPGQRRVGWIDWRYSQAKEVILWDLESGALPLDADAVPAVEAWEHYRHLPEFSNVIFSQFEKRLHDHRIQLGTKANHIEKQMAALTHDRALHPPATHNQKGERVFYLSPAYSKLVQDVTEERHLTMSVPQLFYSRPEYFQEWEYERFAARVKQEVARQKFVYHCEVKRAEKAAKAAKKKASIAQHQFDLEASRNSSNH